jgi:hypothetical protein
MGIEETYLRREIAIRIIENCNHIDPDEPTCVHCVEAAKIALTQ